MIFVGFNAGDFHLNQAINDLAGLREKAFFINRPTAQADPDITAAQKRLGTPLFIGRAGLADSIAGLLAEDAPKEPRLASFRRYTPPDPATKVPTQAQIEDLFLYGKIEPGQIARDYSNDVSEYHVLRGAIDEMAPGSCFSMDIHAMVRPWSQPILPIDCREHDLSTRCTKHTRIY